MSLQCSQERQLLFPALAYIAQNMLLLSAMLCMNAGVFQMVYQARWLVSMVIGTLVLRRSTSSRQYASVGLLLFGTFLMYLDASTTLDNARAGPSSPAAHQREILISTFKYSHRNDSSFDGRIEPYRTSSPYPPMGSSPGARAEQVLQELARSAEMSSHLSNGVLCILFAAVIGEVTASYLEGFQRWLSAGVSGLNLTCFELLGRPYSSKDLTSPLPLSSSTSSTRSNLPLYTPVGNALEGVLMPPAYVSPDCSTGDMSATLNNSIDSLTTSKSALDLSKSFADSATSRRNGLPARKDSVSSTSAFDISFGARVRRCSERGNTELFGSRSASGANTPISATARSLPFALDASIGKLDLQARRSSTTPAIINVMLAAISLAFLLVARVCLSSSEDDASLFSFPARQSSFLAWAIIAQASLGLMHGIVLVEVPAQTRLLAAPMSLIFTVISSVYTVPDTRLHTSTVIGILAVAIASYMISKTSLASTKETSDSRSAFASPVSASASPAVEQVDMLKGLRPMMMERTRSQQSLLPRTR
ncbi:hypothetical protein E5Q_03529 [Mixia osmundae IAM 14324]|uniref:Uncharacterized protein n=1 Tax=Mixia osmundae (strain CBS 9802 / IAM 14324 / JCM 22182 / KY 12970) TaxID=764103 RepID=G7E219_MIXOS|nr:hypothetical protein E5Q_03529 [Mixia osmundae IAM 14324]